MASYTAIRELAVGGMAKVALARAEDGTLVVLKRPLNETSSAYRRLFDEASLGLRIRHPAVVRTIELLEESGKPMLVLEYVAGMSMQALRPVKNLPRGLVALIGAQVCDGLAAIHNLVDENGRPLHALHRDISGGNIIVGLDGQARLIDLGIARSDERITTMTASGDVRGTLRYMAPELFEEQKQSAKSDLWAVGIVLLEALIGGPVTKGSTVEIISQIAAMPPLVRTELFSVDPEFAAALSPLLTVDVASRLGDAVVATRMLASLAERLGGTREALARFVADAQNEAPLPEVSDETDSWSSLLDRRTLPAAQVVFDATQTSHTRIASHLPPPRRSPVRYAAVAGAIVAAAGLGGLELVERSEAAAFEAQLGALAERHFAGEAQKKNPAPSVDQAAVWAEEQERQFDALIGKRHRTPLLPRGTTWRYLDTGVDPGPSWFQPGFDDRAWKEGAARLGYGDDGERTTLSFGADARLKHPAYFFRRTFAIPASWTFARLAVRVARDDCAVVYLNGREIVRDNAPEDFGRADYTPMRRIEDLSIQDDEQYYKPFLVDGTALLPGENVIAVEVHQSSGDSSDVGFDLELWGLTDGPPKL